MATCKLYRALFKLDPIKLGGYPLRIKLKYHTSSGFNYSSSSSSSQNPETENNEEKQTESNQLTLSSTSYVSERLEKRLKKAKSISEKLEGRVQMSDETKEILEDFMKNDEQPALDVPVEFPSDSAKYLNWYRSQERKAYRPKVDPATTTIFLFPGQGSQFVGMGKALLDYPNVREMFEIASNILGYNLLEICLNGPKKELDKTRVCQPAVLVTSLAAAEKVKTDNLQVSGEKMKTSNKPSL